jgi:hypothetical protein
MILSVAMLLVVYAESHQYLRYSGCRYTDCCGSISGRGPSKNFRLKNIHDSVKLNCFTACHIIFNVYKTV